MGKFIDLTGQRFGRLTVLYRAENSVSGKVQWLCRCDCDKTVITATSALRSGETRSCGCLQREKAKETVEYARHIRALHERRKNRHLYSVWYNMIKRCRDPSCASYRNYGRRGICVCDEWESDYYAFECWALSSGYSAGLTIDRINNDGGYSPNNCRWATYKVQNNNYRRNVVLSYKGTEKTIAEWAEETGFSHAIIWQRIFMLHWPIERALTEPVHKKNKKRLSQSPEP